MVKRSQLALWPLAQLSQLLGATIDDPQGTKLSLKCEQNGRGRLECYGLQEGLLGPIPIFMGQDQCSQPTPRLASAAPV